MAKEKAIIYYVCSMWTDDDNMPFITKDGYAYVEEFTSPGEAINYLKMLNDRKEPNIVRCISTCHPKDWHKHMCKSDNFKPTFNGLLDADVDRDILFYTKSGHYGVGYKPKDTSKLINPYCLRFREMTGYMMFDGIESWRYADEAIKD